MVYKRKFNFKWVTWVFIKKFFCRWIEMVLRLWWSWRLRSLYGDPGDIPPISHRICFHNILFYFWWYLGTTYAIEWFFYMSLCDIEIICPCKTCLYFKKKQNFFSIRAYYSDYIISTYAYFLYFLLYCGCGPRSLARVCGLCVWGGVY